LGCDPYRWGRCRTPPSESYAPTTCDMGRVAPPDARLRRPVEVRCRTSEGHRRGPPGRENPLAPPSETVPKPMRISFFPRLPQRVPISRRVRGCAPAPKTAPPTSDDAVTP
jgi:hypothetical protein